jgi:hypothetical protein
MILQPKLDKWEDEDEGDKGDNQQRIRSKCAFPVNHSLKFLVAIPPIIGLRCSYAYSNPMNGYVLFSCLDLFIFYLFFILVLFLFSIKF